MSNSKADGRVATSDKNIESKDPKLKRPRRTVTRPSVAPERTTMPETPAASPPGLQAAAKPQSFPPQRPTGAPATATAAEPKKTTTPAPVAASPQGLQAAAKPQSFPPQRPTGAPATATAVEPKKTTLPKPAAASPQGLQAAARPESFPPQRPSGAPATTTASEPKLDTILAELRGVRETVQKMGTAAKPVPAAAPRTADSELEASVDSLRRLLSELIEQRMESVVRDLAEVRRLAATGDGSRGPIIERLDHVLDKLGAIQFHGEPMDVLDPLIHEVAAERTANDVPNGVILHTLRPGYRTARGAVVCKAAVAISRRA